MNPKSDAAALLYRVGLRRQGPNESYLVHNREFELLLGMGKEARSSRMNLKAAGNVLESPVSKTDRLLSEYPGVRDLLVDIGSGPGGNSAQFSRIFKRVLAIEPSRAAVELSKRSYPPSRYPNIEWRVGFAELELGALKLEKPACFFTGIVLSHIDDETVARICAGLDQAAPDGSILNFVECWGADSHQKLWHTRTREWWAEALSGWILDFHGPSIQGREDRHMGFHGVKGGFG